MTTMLMEMRTQRMFPKEIPPESLLSRVSAGLHDASVAELCDLPVRRIDRTLHSSTGSHRHFMRSCMWLLFTFCASMRNELRCFFYYLLNILLIRLWTLTEVQHPVHIE